jgi:hypothetical protein
MNCQTCQENFLKNSKDCLYNVCILPKPDQFEYKTSGMGSFPLEVALNKFGADGWELAGVWHDTYIFKRKII